MSEEVANKPNISKAILERLQSLEDLPHFPDALIKLEYVLSTDENIKIDEIVQLIVQDPRLVAGLIGVVNTAKYTTGNHITDLAEAISRVGLKDVRLMAHAINFKESFKRKPPFSQTRFIKHALLSAFIAQGLAKVLKLNSGDAFLCGLMRDIGIYLLAIEDREGYLKVIKLAGYDISKLTRSEVTVFGTQHAMMSARLLQKWGFPQEVVLGIAHHHAPDKAAPQFQPYAYLTYLAEQAVFRLNIDNGIADLSAGDQESPSLSLLRALNQVGLTLEAYDELIHKAYEAAEEVGLHN
ncbi:HDOD domain-containing protein [Thiomicrorhabdus arctica]|jgi:putative nucleotidyltransferase with HDIG domain|uniref:HDOD domain-containing protein n=1 Tax=Thiomicrorhabdus arctica TaxID=131540 RepID=UPI00037E5F91|nr:HDOD domain-containing protein [Thiomicrorhabdus arctica]